MFRNATASNLMLIRTSDQMKLVYKPAFFTTIYDASGDGAVMALLAHEVGHAIDGVASPSWMKRNPRQQPSEALCLLLQGSVVIHGINGISPLPAKTSAMGERRADVGSAVRGGRDRRGRNR
jgi:hypothetical protein